MTDLERLLRTLSDGNVEFIVVGGVAGAVLGSARATFDLDVVYSRTSENLERMADALAPLKPHLRGAPVGLPFRLDVETLRRGLNFTLSTTAGALDLLGEIAGGGTYSSLIGDSIEVHVFGHSFRCLNLEQLIAAKRAAGRTRDLEAISELEALREERDRPR